MATRKKSARSTRASTRKKTKRKKRVKTAGAATATRSRSRSTSGTRKKTIGTRGRGAIRDASLDVLRAEIKRRIETLEKRRQVLLTELDTVESEIAVAAGTLGGNGYHRPGSGRGRTRRRPRNELNLVESLQKVLKSKTMSVTEMSGAVQRAGYRTTSPNFRTIVNQTLIKNPKLFKRVSRGRYTAK